MSPGIVAHLASLRFFTWTLLSMSVFSPAAHVAQAGHVAHAGHVTPTAHIAQAGHAAHVAHAAPAPAAALALPASNDTMAILADPADPGNAWMSRPIARLDFRGLRRTQPGVLRREISSQPGTRLDADRLSGDRLRLLDLGLFAEVTVQARRDSLYGQPVVVVSVRERPSLLAWPQVEWNREDGISAGASISHANFRGRHERLAASALAGGRRHAAVRFSTPWTLGRRLGTGVQTYYSRSRNHSEELIDERRGMALSVIPSPNPRVAFPIHVGAERARVEPDPGGSSGGNSGERAACDIPPVGDEESAGGNSGDVSRGFAHDPTGASSRVQIDDHRWVELGAWRDTRGWRARPSGGSRMALRFVQHGGPLGGDTDLQRYHLDLLRAFPTGDGATLTVAGRLAWSRGTVPRYLRLGLGGGETLRGHDRGGYRGDSRAHVWLEQRFPLLPTYTLSVWRGRYALDLTLDGAVFLDAGSVWERDQLRRGEARGRAGGGAGLRLVAPFVELFNLDVATDGDKLRVYAWGGIRL